MLSFEETEAAINKTRSNLEDALDRRDYIAAAKIQRKLDGFVATRDYLIEQSKIHDNTSELNRLELQRQHEEDELKERMSQRMDRLLRDYKLRLEQMERRHADEIARVDRKYSDVRYYTPRVSPYVTVLGRAEDFYARHRDYGVAAVLQSQGVPMETIARLTGHTDIKTTDHYLHISDDSLADAVAALEAIV